MRVLDFDFDNILLDKKSYETSYQKFWFMTYHTKHL